MCDAYRNSAKPRNLEVADRIELFVSASETVVTALRKHEGYLRAETLAVSVVFGTGPEGAARAEADVDGQSLVVALTKTQDNSGQTQPE